MSKTKLGAVTGVGLIGALLASPAHAQSAGSSEEIALLKQQLRLMEQKLEKLEKQTSANTTAAANANAKANSVANANAAIAVKGPVALPEAIVKMPNNRPTICTADEQNCIAITSQLHFDVGGYDYRPNTAATVPQYLDNGINARRARLGVLGKFLGDWNYGLVYEFGGSSDGFGGTAAGSLPGGGASGINKAYLSYTGFKPFGGKLAIEGGYISVPYTLDDSTSANDILFMERASPNVVATNIAAGDGRAAFGARWHNDVFWAGAYVTGPTPGAIHSASSVAPAGVTEQYGVTARAAGQILSGKDYSIHIGGNGLWLLEPPRNRIANTQTLTLSDRPELRIDPTQLITTGALANVDGAQVYSVEAAATYGPLFFQGEYFWFHVDRDAGLGPALPDVNFEGGYAQASWVITGETHTYNSSTGAYNGIKPKNPFSLGGGWGAWEIAGRFSTIDLNDRIGLANGVAGGRQNIYTAGLNWYVSNNIRFMFNYLHGDVVRQVSSTNFGDVGSDFDAFAMRTQVAF